MTELRPATPLDAGTVGAILTEFVRETPWMPQLHSAAENISFAGQMIERGWVSVAHKGAQIEGFSACSEGEVLSLYVAAGARGQSIGTALLEDLKQRDDRLVLWCFQANQRAQVFYARHGFVETQRSDGARNDEKLPDIQLAWQRQRR